jgi:hypothetical protein
MSCLPIAARLLWISTIFDMKGFWVLQLGIARQERESEQIMNLLLSEEEATNFKARRIA